MEWSHASGTQHPRSHTLWHTRSVRFACTNSQLIPRDWWHTQSQSSHISATSHISCVEKLSHQISQSLTRYHSSHITYPPKYLPHGIPRHDLAATAKRTHRRGTWRLQQSWSSHVSRRCVRFAVAAMCHADRELLRNELPHVPRQGVSTLCCRAVGLTGHGLIEATAHPAYYRKRPNVQIKIAKRHIGVTAGDSRRTSAAYPQHIRSIAHRSRRRLHRKQAASLTD